MDGIQFLTQVRRDYPDTIRMVLTGQADMQAAIDAINEGHIFRFLTKPLAVEQMRNHLNLAIEQYRLVNAEKELLDRTLKGSIKIMVDILGFVAPRAFSRSERIRHLARRLGQRLQVDHLWEIELASLLSQIGFVTIPASIQNKYFHGDSLNEDEREIFLSHPQTACRLLQKIPRLEEIAEGIYYQSKNYGGGGFPPGLKKGKDIPVIGRVLRVVSEFDKLISQGIPMAKALETMRSHREAFDPALLAALEAELIGAEEGYTVRWMRLEEMMPGMILADDIRNLQGTVLIPRSVAMTEVLKMSLINFARLGEVQEPLKILEEVHPERI
ncbi:MAG TPA: HD domain-containing phosphohydrolase [Syntrophomonadaceae bacterium]|nr:HD domain-containing phosphohydrolase [Syntrophomonadaceae bacterium]